MAIETLTGRTRVVERVKRRFYFWHSTEHVLQVEERWPCGPYAGYGEFLWHSGTGWRDARLEDLEPLNAMGVQPVLPL